MAPVTGDRDRAQLILVGGLVIAVGLVGLAIVLNSGIYTHNLASRADPTASQAVGHTVVVRDSVGGLVEFAVRHHPNDLAAQEANVTDGLPKVSELIARESSRRSVLTNVTVTATVGGRTVQQTGDRVFTDGAGAEDWEVADDAGGVRSFRMDVERGSLNESSPPLQGGVFNVTFDSGGGDVVVSIYEDGGATGVMVTDEAAGRSFGPCTDASGSRTGIDLTGATVAGEHCAALERLDGLSPPFDVEFADAANVSGSYSLVVDTIDLGNVVPPGDPGPSALETLYGVRVEVRFQSQRVDYRTTIEVAPGEPDG